MGSALISSVRRSQFHGLDPAAVLARWSEDHRGEFYPYKVMDIEMDTFWDRLAHEGESFWIGLQALPWFEDLYDSLSERGHVVFCTSSTRAPACVAGKLKWLQDRFGNDFQDYIFTAHKDRLAHSGACLIDDFDLNVERFSARGGNGILFPQFWNANHLVETDRLEYVLDRIERMN